MDNPPFNHPWVDESKAPIYRCKFPDPLTQEALEAYLSHLETWIEQAPGYYAWIIYPDLRTQQLRLAMGESQKRRAPHEKGHCSGYAFVVENAFMRGVLTAMMWLGPHHSTLRVFENEDKAYGWIANIHAQFVAREQLEQARLAQLANQRATAAPSHTNLR